MDAEGRTERQADAGKSLAAVILGNDAVAAIRPYAVSQLARACVAAGFDVVVPPSWGDELVAGVYLEQLADRLEYAIAPCACALVRSMLERPGASTAVGCAFAAAPPVAAARYVRARYGEGALITFVGDCPSGSDPAIDARFPPAGFLASLDRQGISIEGQTTETSAAESDRWRRFLSTPGGVPALRYLARPPINRVLRDADADALTHALPDARSNMVVDFSIAANCACSGAGANVDDYELPRSRAPIIVPPNGLDLGPGPSSPRVRLTLRARADNRTEPRAAASDEPEARVEIPDRGPPVRPTPREPAARTSPEVDPPTSTRRRVTLLALIPIAVLAVATALGVSVYRANQPPASAPTPSRVAPPLASDSGALRTADSSMGYAPNRRIDSARAAADSASDSGRTRRRQAIQVVPGWLPQGRAKFAPVDSSTARKP